MDVNEHKDYQILQRLLTNLDFQSFNYELA